MARCSDEAVREWTPKRWGPFIVSTRPFYVPKETTNGPYDCPPFSCVNRHTFPPTSTRLLPCIGCHYPFTPGLTANGYGPLSFPMKEGLKVGGSCGEYMSLGIVRRILRSGLRSPLPNRTVESLCYGISGWYRFTALYNKVQYVKRVSWLV